MTTETKIDEKVSIKIEPPKLWKVVFMNDDQTPMEFVIELLVGVFKHSQSSAKDLTMEIHNTGSAIAGTYIYEIAEQRGLEATQLSRANGFPLRIQVEQE
jgi:ATP-dependent Clp protease adaptor protein ClpS